MGNQTGGLNVDDDAAIKEAFKAAADTKRPVAVHAEDTSMLALTRRNSSKPKKSAPADYLRAHTEAVDSKRYSGS